MKLRLTRRQIILAGLATWATAGQAAPRRYELPPARSYVKFSFRINGSRQTGEVPVSTADIRIDPENLTSSFADVVADVKSARTGFAPLTQALLSKTVLDGAGHPTARFVSSRIIPGDRGRISEGAVIDGNLTLRGVTRPISLDAFLSRPAGTAVNDLSLLSVTLTGTLNRHDFGAAGYGDLVADTVDLNIHAEIRARS